MCNPKGIGNQGPHGEGDLENLQALTKLLGKWGWFPCNLVRASKSPPSFGNLVKEVPQENQVPQGSCKSPSSLGNLLEKVVRNYILFFIILWKKMRILERGCSLPNLVEASSPLVPNTTLFQVPLSPRQLGWGSCLRNLFKSPQRS